jgi:hypothetical protein
MTWTNSTQVPLSQSPNRFLTMHNALPVPQLDNDGHILVQAILGAGWPPHYVLLIPDGVSADPPAVPELATWAVFATLIGGWMAHERLRRRARFSVAPSDT